MSVEISYDSTIDAIVLKAIGKMTFSDFRGLSDRIVACPGFHKNINQVLDVSDGGFDLSMGDIERIAEEFMDKSESLGTERRVAIIVSRDVDYGMTRQYDVFFDAGPGVEIRSFKSMDEGRRWLKKND